MLIARTMDARIRKRTIRNKPATATKQLAKIKKDENQIDKTTLKMLTRNSKVPGSTSTIVVLPLHN